MLAYIDVYINSIANVPSLTPTPSHTHKQSHILTHIRGGAVIAVVFLFLPMLMLGKGGSGWIYMGGWADGWPRGRLASSFCWGGGWRSTLRGEGGTLGRQQHRPGAPVITSSGTRCKGVGRVTSRGCKETLAPSAMHRAGPTGGWAAGGGRTPRCNTRWEFEVLVPRHDLLSLFIC